MTINCRNNKRAPLWRALSLLLVSCALLAAARPAPQEEDDETRRLWNKQFLNARARARKPRPAPQSQTAKTNPKTTARPKAKSAASADETADDELIGVTIWRLRMVSAANTRLSAEEKGSAPVRYWLERVTADTPFQEGQIVRISVEAPREFGNYLYVVDREVYKDNRGERLGEPYLIFPTRGTPPGGNEISDGRSVYVPAQGDPAPYFTLQRSGANHVGEMLAILITEKPLPVNVERPALDPAMLALWERQCGGRTERREAKGGAGKEWTKAEQEAGEGKRKLVQSDPLPQTIYRVKAKQSGCSLITVPLRISP